jgi:hypothetical protein
MPPMSTNSRGHGWVVRLLRLAGSVVILALLFRFVPFPQAWQAMRRLPPPLWFAVLAAYLCGHLVGVYKYRLMLNGAGAGLSFVQALRCYFAGLFGALVLPSIVGGDLVRVGLALRLSRSRAGALLGSFLDRLVDAIALLTLTVIGIALSPSALNPAGRRILLIIVSALAGAGLALVAFLLAVPARRLSYRVRRRLVRLRGAMQSIARQPKRVLAAYGLGLVIQGSFLALTTILASACELHLPFQAWLFAWPLAKLSALLPVGQGGIGVREAALAILLSPFGRAGGIVVGVSLVWETVIIAGGLIAGGVALAVGRLPAGQSRQRERGTAQSFVIPPP